MQPGERSSTRWLGPTAVFALLIGFAVLWILERPSGGSTGSFVGQLLGAESILMMSIAIVLISTLPWVDAYFDGIDHAAIWHRNLAIIGLLLLVPHILMSHNHGSSWAGTAGIIATVGLVSLALWAMLPRWRSLVPSVAHGPILGVLEWAPLRAVGRLVGDYEIWRILHRTTGLFLAIAVAHGLGDSSLFDAPALRWSYLAVSFVGLAFYAYRELLARRGHGLRDYQVREVRAVREDLAELVLRPLGKPFRYAPGQFAMLHLESKEGWQRHPFTISSSPDEEDVRFTIKALGDYTTRLPGLLEPGMPAVISGPHGRFTHAKGTGHQIWVAGGVGVTPFLSWMRSLDAHPCAARVDFFYTVADDAPFEEELRAIADAQPTLRLHVVRSQVEGRLTAATLLSTSAADPLEASAFMCGPGPMLEALDDGLRDLGVPSSRIFREHFDWR